MTDKECKILPKNIQKVRGVPSESIETEKTSRNKSHALSDRRLGLNPGRASITTFLRPWRDMGKE